MSENSKTTTPQKTMRYCNRCLTSFDRDLEVCANLSCQNKRPNSGWEKILDSGEVFDRRFKIHRCLAIGGSGISYLAKRIDDENAETGPFVALKVLFIHHSHGTYVRRLATEAHILESLEHPNIIQYLGFVHISGQSPYLITKFAHGGSLLDHLKKHGALSIKAAAEVGIQIIDALLCSHEKGVIHRDLKPENILLEQKTSKGGPFSVRVADFGIAKVDSTLASHLTHSGMFIGTPNFAAPEQFTGGQTDSAADIFALAALLRYSITGRYLINIANALQSLSEQDILEMFRSRLPSVVDNDVEGTEHEIATFNALLHEAMQLEKSKRCSGARMRDLLHAIILPPAERKQADEATTITNQANDKSFDEQVAKTYVPPPSAPTMPTNTLDSITIPKNQEKLELFIQEAPTEQNTIPKTEPTAHPRKTKSLRLSSILLIFVCFLIATAAGGFWFYEMSFVEPKDKKEIKSIDQQLAVHKTEIAQKCKIKEQNLAKLVLYVDQRGNVRRQKILEKTKGVDHKCLRKELLALQFKRSTASKIQYTSTVNW